MTEFSILKKKNVEKCEVIRGSSRNGGDVFRRTFAGRKNGASTCSTRRFSFLAQAVLAVFNQSNELLIATEECAVSLHRRQLIFAAQINGIGEIRGLLLPRYNL